MAPAVMRVKLDRPEAAGMRCGGRPDSVIVTSGMKKHAIATPWISVGIMMVMKSVWMVNSERIHSTTPNTMKAKLA